MIPSQERILKLCSDRGTTISKLEKDLGFGNGYIKTKREREFPADRLSKIANALGVTTDYLTYGEDNHYQQVNRRFLVSQLEALDEELGTKKPAADDGNGYDEKHKMVNELFDRCSPDDQDLAINFLKTLSDRQSTQGDMQATD